MLTCTQSTVYCRYADVRKLQIEDSYSSLKSPHVCVSHRSEHPSQGSEWVRQRCWFPSKAPDRDRIDQSASSIRLLSHAPLTSRYKLKQTLRFIGIADFPVYTSNRLAPSRGLKLTLHLTYSPLSEGFCNNLACVQVLLLTITTLF